MKIKRIGKLLFINGIILLVTLIFAEIVLSLVIDYPDGYYVYDPGSEFQFPVDSTYIPGVDEEISQVRFNSLGGRASEIPDGTQHKILALGGSTTVCFALNQDKVWTTILDHKLGPDYWVGNFGRLGNDTNHHVYQLQQLLNHTSLENTEAVVFLIGINDFGHFLANGRGYTEMNEYAAKLSGFAQLPDAELPFHRRLVLFKLLKNAKQNISSIWVDASYGKVQHERRILRQSQDHVKQLPDLTEALARYEQNIRDLITILKKKQITPIFITQPAMWDENLSPDLEQLLLMGGGYREDKPEELIFYSSEALAGGMTQFNERLLAICEEEAVLCFDLASILPKNTSVFYDDCHFNISGAQMVGTQVYQYLWENYLD